MRRLALFVALLLAAPLLAGAETWNPPGNLGAKIRNTYRYTDDDSIGASSAVTACPEMLVGFVANGAEVELVACETEAQDAATCELLVAYSADSDVDGDRLSTTLPYVKARRISLPDADLTAELSVWCGFEITSRSGNGSGGTPAPDTETFNEIMSGDLTGGISVAIPAGTCLEDAVIAPTSDDNSRTVVQIQCEGGSGFCASETDAARGGYNETTGLEMQEGITTLRTMNITDAAGSFAVGCAACNFTTAGFTTGQKVALAGFGNLPGDADTAFDWTITGAVTATSITLSDPTNIVTASGSGNGNEQVYARRVPAVYIDWTNVGHDAEFMFKDCSFRGVGAQGDIALLVRNVDSGNGGRVTLVRPMAQNGWEAGDSFFVNEGGLDGRGPVNLKVLDGHLEGSATLFDYHHLTDHNTTTGRLDVEGGFITMDVGAQGACLDAALSDDPSVQSKALAARFANVVIEQGCQGFRFGHASTIYLDVIHRDLLAAGGNLPGYVSLYGGLISLSGQIAFTGAIGGIVGATRPLIYLDPITGATNQINIGLEVYDRRGTWFNVTNGGQLIGGQTAGTGGLFSFLIDLALCPACTRNATFISTTPLNSAARGAVYDVTANRVYRANGASIFSDIRAVPDAESGTFDFGDTDDTARDTGTEVCTLRGRTCAAALDTALADDGCGNTVTPLLPGNRFFVLCQD